MMDRCLGLLGCERAGRVGAEQTQKNSGSAKPTPHGKLGKRFDEKKTVPLPGESGLRFYIFTFCFSISVENCFDDLQTLLNQMK